MTTRRGFIKEAGVLAGGVLATGGVAESQTRGTAASTSMAEKLRELLKSGEPVLAPAAHDVLTARLIEATGFPVITVGGSAVSAQHMIPDVGLITITELIEFAGNIAESVNIPVFADGDDGGGSPINVYRATRNFEKRGLAAVMYEDTVTIKHLGGRSDLVTKAQMVDKIKAAVDARTNNIVIIARTDALSERETMEQALDRGAAYSEAGADMIFFSGMNLNDTAKAQALVKKPLMSTVNATTAPARLKEAKIAFGVYAGQLLQISLGAAYQALQELKTTGLMTNSLKTQIPTDVYAKLIESAEVTARARKYNLLK